MNQQNDVIYADSREDADKKYGLHELDKFPTTVMIWVGLTKFGPTSVVRIPETLDSQKYIRTILPIAKRDGNSLFGSRDWIFQQDGATSHTSNVSQNWCKNNFKIFLNKTHWPANSPDLNPLDYYFWDAVVKKIKINKKKKCSKDEFYEKIKSAVGSVCGTHIKNAVSCFSQRVRKVENAAGKKANLK